MPRTEAEELAEFEECLCQGWYPQRKNGNPKTPNVIRNDIRKFLQEEWTSTKTAFLREIGVNANSFNKYMSGNYKNKWSATSNGTHYAAGVFLERERIKKKYRKKNDSKKRKRDDASAGSSSSSSTSSSSKKSKKDEGMLLLASIATVDVPLDSPVYDNCDIIRRKINRFLMDSCVSQAAFLRALGGIQAGSLANFRKMKGKGAGASNCIYPAAYRFFEQKRILDNKPKSNARKEAELNFGAQGYRLRHDDGRRWVISGGEYDPAIFDIDLSARRRREMGENNYNVHP
jgi:hypothetical protein